MTAAIVPAVLFFALLPGQAAEAPAEAADVNLADYYGFDPVEVFDATGRLFQVVPGDFGGDDRTDLAIVDNGGSRIQLMIQADAGEKLDASDSSANAYLLPTRLQEEKILVDRAITAMAGGDFNGDGQTDLVTIEQTDIVQVRLQRDGDFRENPPLRLADLGSDPFDVAAGDFDGDGLDDLVVLGIRNTYLVLADADQRDGFADPQLIPNTSDDLDYATLVDLDGDDRLDLFYAAFGEEGYTLCLRLQERGRLGAELRMEENDIRAVAIANCDDWPGAEVVSIDSGTGRVRIQKLQQRQAEEGRRLAQVGLGGSSGGDRGWVVADLDGDKRPEVVVAEPDTAELLLLRSSRGGLQPAERFPSLLDIQQIVAVQRPANPRDMMDSPASDLLLLSGEEETVAVVSLEAQKGGEEATGLSLPRPVAIEGEPVALAVAASRRQNETAFLLTNGSGRGNDYTLSVLQPGEDRRDWTAAPLSLSDETQDTLDDLDVSSMQAGDFDGDGRLDLLITAKREPARVLFGTDPTAEAEGNERDEQNTDSPAPALDFAFRSSNGFQLPELSPDQVVVSRSGRELVLAQGRYGRQLTWQDGGWQVASQVNAPSAGARVDLLSELSAGGAAIIDNAGDRLLLTTDEGDLADEVELGDLNVQRLAVADIDGDRADDLLLLAGGRVGVLGSRADRRELQTVATYEQEDDDAFFDDVVAGDFNGDGLTDLILSETGEHTLEILALAPEPLEILPADRFKLFEEKSFRGGSGGPEPREMHAVDLTGDGRSDLLLLIGDRLLLFPQDTPGEAGDE